MRHSFFKLLLLYILIYIIFFLLAGFLIYLFPNLGAIQTVRTILHIFELLYIFSFAFILCNRTHKKGLWYGLIIVIVFLTIKKGISLLAFDQSLSLCWNDLYIFIITMLGMILGTRIKKIF